jgi:Raf kinase inhibitor-like YbhB/YbcL family protein
MRLAPAFILALTLAGGGQAVAETAMAGDPPAVTLQRLPRAETHARILVTSPAFAAGAPIPPAYVASSPPLAWTAWPGAKAYVVILEDPDAPSPTPFLHWIVWDIPGSTTSLPAGLATKAHPPQAPRAVQGKNDAGGLGYFGPHPPKGPAHHYHFQVIALDAPLGLEPQTGLDELTAAMKPHLLGSGELVGTYQSK